MKIGKLIFDNGINHTRNIWWHILIEYDHDLYVYTDINLNYRIELELRAVRYAMMNSLELYYLK